MSVLAAERAKALVDPKPDPSADNALLNTLLVAERNAIATYTAGAGIITKDTTTPKATRDTVLAVAVHFQNQHKDHAAALAKLITDNGGTPSTDEGTASIPASFPAATATTPDVVKLAADKEKAAAVAYTTVVQSLSTSAAATLAAAIGGVETQHFIVLYLLAESLISATAKTLTSADLVVPASFILNVGLSGTTHLDDTSLDAALAYDVKAT